MTRRRVFSLVTVSLWVLTMALPLSAKIIPSETEVLVDGTTVTVNLKSDEPGGPGDLQGMYAVFPAGSLDVNGRPVGEVDGIAMTVSRVEPYIYQGTIEVPESGEWALVPLPDETGIPLDMFPTTAFTVPELGIPGVGVALLAGLGVLIVAGVVWFVAFRDRAPAWAMFRKPGTSRP